MHIGLDFDGTIVVYGKVFHRHAAQLFGMPATVPAAKAAIRDYFWSLPDGKNQWIELQAVVYGTKMKEAEMAPGLDQFLRWCKEQAVPISIISHKTEFPARGPQVNLRDAARAWLIDHHFFSSQGFNLPRGSVFFESTREDKITRIRSEGCSHFIDDLLEVFADSSFPPSVARILYGAETPPANLPPGVEVFATWSGIDRHFRQGVAWKRP